jgi:hypothetical protein
MAYLRPNQSNRYGGRLHHAVLHHFDWYFLCKRIPTNQPDDVLGLLLVRETDVDRSRLRHQPLRAMEPDRLFECNLKIEIAKSIFKENFAILLDILHIGPKNL